jgi:ABC-type transporter Mla MlaB component
MRVISDVAGKALLILEGPIRLAQVAELLEHVRAAAANGCDVEVDLGAAEHLHAAGLQILRALERNTLQQHRKFRILAASESARNALELCGLGSWLSGKTL